MALVAGSANSTSHRLPAIASSWSRKNSLHIVAALRLDYQPEATRRIYAEEFEIPLRELGLEPDFC
jgi:hypothetical protein